MTLTVYILIAIPICILAILIWTYFDYRKYKREHHLIILLVIVAAKINTAQKINAIKTKGEIALFTVYTVSGKLMASLLYTAGNNARNRQR